MLVCQDSKTAAMLVCQTNPVAVEFFSEVKTFVLVCIVADHVGENALYQYIANSENVAQRLFFLSDPVQTSNFSLPNQILQLSRRKKLTFESIKSDISKLGRTMH